MPATVEFRREFGCMSQPDLFAPDQRQELDLPPVNYGPIKCAVGQIHCALLPARRVAAEPAGDIQLSKRVKEPVHRLETGETIIITTRKLTTLPAGVDGILLRDGAGALSWQAHAAIRDLEQRATEVGWPETIQERARGWDGKFNFRAEQANPDGTVDPGKEGLRPPQVGALHAIGAHWSLYKRPATVVMPTGTGKTETMLAALAAFMRDGPVLVTVPSKVLRSQTARKFLTFGLLRKLKALDADAPNPIVGVVTKRPGSIADLEIFERCNVIVGTMSSLAEGVAAPLAAEIAARVGTLVVDEAHHIAATHWGQFRDAFKQRRILQFTATPFRRDAKLVDGQVIYNYPLKMAQEDGYFKPISFVPVHELTAANADQTIAETAAEKLRADLSAGLNHLMMARCNTIDRATEVFAIYQRIAPDLNPMLVHSELTDTDARVADLRAGRNRIAVCVNMLGEGFDLPELKVAAIHDLHKSLAILLQFTGRFTRSSGENIGDATIVANVADTNVSAALERLYSEDADWNVVLSELSSQAAKDHAELIDFLNSTTPLDESSDKAVAISHQLLRPTMSTLTYRADDFFPKKFHEGLPRTLTPNGVWLHSASETLFFVTRAEPGLKWTRAKDVRDRVWALFVLHYDRERKLLFLSSTDHSSNFANLAKAVGASSLIDGDQIFRSLGRINRLIFQNVGLKKPGRRNLGYAMYTGSDVAEALSIAERGASVKNNMSGTGWEGGRHVAIGCSAKGRVWSREQGPINRFSQWCGGLGEKLLDNSIRTEDIIKNVLIPTAVTELPDAEALCFEWPYEILAYLEERVVFSDGTREESLFAFDLELLRLDRSSNVIEFQLVHAISGAWGSFTLQIGGSDPYRVTQTSGAPLTVTVGKLTATLESYFQDFPPMVRFVDLRELDGNHLIGPQDPQNFTIDDARFDAWDWAGVDFAKESMWKDGAARPDSIQWHVAQHYVGAGFSVVFDDDASGEAADLVCLKEEDDHIRLAFVHCKFAGGATAGERVKDVVEVCSQAIRCAKWNGRFNQLVHHLKNRNEKLTVSGRPTRYVAGTPAALGQLRKNSQFKTVRAEVVVVQPGLSKAGRTAEQTAVMAAASTYLKETIGIDLDFICSA